MTVVLFDDEAVWKDMLPLTFTRPVSHIRIGILRISEKWEKSLDAKIRFQTQEYLQDIFPNANDAELYIASHLLPSTELVKSINELQHSQWLIKDDQKLAFKGSHHDFVKELTPSNTVEFQDSIQSVTKPWNIFKLNGQEIRNDFQLITKDRTSQQIEDPFTKVYAPENVFVEEGVAIKAAVINAESGPVYLGKNAEVQEGALIKGPFVLGEHSVVNMGAKVRGDCTVGPYCKVGGEISNSILFGYSNKGHDGFLGNAVIGEWCNLGADTNNSNLKNNYKPVKIWNYQKNGFENTGEQFCGLIMGDHSKCGINTMFNTGTVVGVGANIFGSGFPRNFVPSFAWGGASGFATFSLQQFYFTAKTVMQRRSIQLTELDKAMLGTIFENTATYRVWENS